MKGILQIDPFPDPTHAGQEIEFVGVMIAELVILLFILLLMLYLHLRVKKNNRLFLPIIIVEGFSLIFGMTCLIMNGLPLTPWIQIFFMVFQTSLFIDSSIIVNYG